MGLDGIFLRAVILELETFVGAKVEKIVQISSYEIVFVLKKFRETKNLLISASANLPKMHFTKTPPKGNLKNFYFETLLKNRLKSAWFFKIYQTGLDRIIYLEFIAKDEIGQEKNFVVAVEFFSRYSNIILYNKETLKIEDSIKRVSLDSYKERPILPKLKFVALKEQEKINILKEDTLKIVKKILSFNGITLKEAIVKCLQGVGGFVAEVLSFKFGSRLIENFDEKDRANLFKHIVFLKNLIEKKEFKFVAVFKYNMLKEFSFFDVSKFCCKFYVKEFNSAAELLDYFYNEKVFLERQTQKTNSITKFLKYEIEKLKNKIKAREKDFEQAVERLQYKEFADVLAANLYKLKKGKNSICLENFYDDSKTVCLKLNPKYDGSKNVQDYYKKYKKAKTAIKKLEVLLKEACEDLKFLQEEYGFVKRCTNEEDFLYILKELNEEKYYFKFNNNEKEKINVKKNLQIDSFLKFKSSDGFNFYCGKNGKQNDLLTVKKAKKDDVWFHASNVSGSHVVVFVNGKTISETAILQAATVALYYSDLKDEKKGQVWYTTIRNIKKEKGSKPGMVNFKNVRTITVNSNFELVEKLRKREK